jgi:hypothetical protein
MLTSVSGLKGRVRLDTKITGPLLEKRSPPKVLGTLMVSGITATYELPSTKKILLRELTGPLQFTNDSVESKGIRLLFPRTDGTLTFIGKDALHDIPRDKLDTSEGRFGCPGKRFIPKLWDWTEEVSLELGLLKP